MSQQQPSVQKLQYQLKKTEGEVESLKRKNKTGKDEFAALQQGVTNKQKILQQRVNRLEQEALEVRRARDVVTKEYQGALKQIIDLGKADGEGKAQGLAVTVEALGSQVDGLRKELDAEKSKRADAEERLVKLQADLDLAQSERDHHKRERQEVKTYWGPKIPRDYYFTYNVTGPKVEAVAEALRQQERERRQQEGPVAGVAGGPKIFSLRGKVVLLVGGGGGGTGVRHALCKALADAGAKIALVDSDEQASLVIQKDLRDLGAECFYVPAELTQPKQVQAALTEGCKSCSATHFDVAINVVPNTTPIAPLSSIQEHEWDRANTAGVKSLLFSCQAEYGIMKGRRTRIINVLPPARGDLVSLTKSLAQEFEQVRVNSISPGTGKEMAVDDIVATVLFLSSDATSHLTGHDLVIDDGSGGTAK